MEKKGLQSASVLKQFTKIDEIPRPSKREGKMIEYLKELGKSHQLETSVDETDNVTVRKSATKGYEDRATMTLRSHMDIVCDRFVDVEFDFDKDAIQTCIGGEWLTAEGTTLGADDDISAVMELAVLESNDIEYGPIECVFTIDEETQLTGALRMRAGFMTGDYLINLDSEDEGKIYISCAGGRSTIATSDHKKEEAPKDHFFMQVSLKDLVGGHSGNDINKKRADTIKVSTKFLFNEQEKFDLRLVSFSNGKLHNVIPHDGRVAFAAPSDAKEQVRADWNVFQHDVMQKFHVTDTNMVFNMENTEPQQAFPKDVSSKLTLALQTVDNGIPAMCQNELLANMVETSNNVAAVKTTGGKIETLPPQHNNAMSNLDNMCSTVKATYRSTGAKIEQTDGYPAWNINPDSRSVELTIDAYKKLFNEESEVLGIYTGFECGLFSERYPRINMVGFGSTLCFVHTPDERLYTPTIQMAWDYLLEILKNTPVRKQCEQIAKMDSWFQLTPRIHFSCSFRKPLPKS